MGRVATNKFFTVNGFADLLFRALSSSVILSNQIFLVAHHGRMGEHISNQMYFIVRFYRFCQGIFCNSFTKQHTVAMLASGLWVERLLLGIVDSDSIPSRAKTCYLKLRFTLFVLKI